MVHLSEKVVTILKADLMGGSYSLDLDLKKITLAIIVGVFIAGFIMLAILLGLFKVLFNT